MKVKYSHPKQAYKILTVYFQIVYKNQNFVRSRVVDIEKLIS